MDRVLDVMSNCSTAVEDASSPCCGQACCCGHGSTHSRGVLHAGCANRGLFADIPLAEGLFFISENDDDLKALFAGPATDSCQAAEFRWSSNEVYQPLPPPVIKSTLASIRTVNLLI